MNLEVHILNLDCETEGLNWARHGSEPSKLTPSKATPSKPPKHDRQWGGNQVLKCLKTVGEHFLLKEFPLWVLMQWSMPVSAGTILLNIPVSRTMRNKPLSLTDDQVRCTTLQQTAGSDRLSVRSQCSLKVKNVLEHS